MIIKLLFAAAVMFLLWNLINRYRRLPPGKKRGALLKSLLGGLFVIVLLGVVTGRMHWLSAVIAGMLPLLRFGTTAAMRLLPLWLTRTGGVASFRTEHLDVKVQIQKAQITGQITKGKYEGQSVDELTDTQLEELEQYYRQHDLKSHYIIRLARQQKGKRYEQRAEPPPFSQPERDEALQILGLKGNPGRQEVIDAHRRLIQKLHPDRGGSDFLAARVNQAKEVLLKNL